MTDEEIRKALQLLKLAGTLNGWYGPTWGRDRAAQVIVLEKQWTLLPAAEGVSSVVYNRRGVAEFIDMCGELAGQ